MSSVACFIFKRKNKNKETIRADNDNDKENRRKHKTIFFCFKNDRYNNICVDVLNVNNKNYDRMREKNINNIQNGMEIAHHDIVKQKYLLFLINFLCVLKIGNKKNIKH